MGTKIVVVPDGYDPFIYLNGSRLRQPYLKHARTLLPAIEEQVRKERIKMFYEKYKTILGK